MATPSFFSTELSVALLENDQPSITLSESESGHAVRSRRLREGQVVNVLNGQGITAHGKINVINKRAVEIGFDSYDVKKQVSPTLTIATAIPKGDRQKVMVDMLTQLGVSEIIPLDCEHSVTRYSDNLRKKWQRAAIESCKQSQNPWLPHIANGCGLNRLIDKPDYCKVYADAVGTNMASVGFSVGDSEISNLMVIIGPEGGLSSAEIALLAGQNIKAVSLNNHILRTEAAAITAIAQFSQVNW